MSRSTGRSVVAAAAYRSGTRLLDERTGQTHDYTRKRVEHAEILAPQDAPGWVYDRERLWNAVEAGERRKDAQLAREIEIALPRELSPDARLRLIRDFAQAEFVSRGMIVDLAVHCPKAVDGRDAPHAHVLMTLRPIEGGGFGKKAREWNDVALLEGWREKWASTANLALERAGDAARIDHRTLAAQGIDHEPEPKLGIVRRLAQAYDQAFDRLNQWLAVRHRNRVRDHLTAMATIDPMDVAHMIGARLAMRQHHEQALAPALSPPIERGYDHER